MNIYGYDSMMSLSCKSYVKYNVVFGPQSFLLPKVHKHYKKKKEHNPMIIVHNLCWRQNLEN